MCWPEMEKHHKSVEVALAAFERKVKSILILDQPTPEKYCKIHYESLAVDITVYLQRKTNNICKIVVDMRMDVPGDVVSVTCDDESVKAAILSIPEVLLMQAETNSIREIYEQDRMMVKLQYGL